ncbi:MAG TPA: penicillin-binding protein 2 [Anaerolineae bacterium]|nr:penicillin-binding protein 2 [Anaerolineae bacterium]
MRNYSGKMDNINPRLRILFFQVLILVAFAVLVAQLWQEQILDAQEHLLQADANRFRLVSIDAPRGVIYDRRHQLLVRNIPRYTVSIVPAALPEDEADKLAVLTRLSQTLDLPVSSKVASAEGTSSRPGIEEILERDTISPHIPVPIMANVDKQIALLIEEEHLFLPGVLLDVASRRQYPNGALISHVAGYVGPIPAEGVQDYLNRPDQDYAASDHVGLMGVEATYEEELRGRKGQKHIEVDAFQREVSILAIDPPQPGHNLVLSLDLNLQQAAEAALREGMSLVDSDAGVVIAMNPQTGEILAQVSLPSYDNNLFAQGISYGDYEALSADPERPLVNHAISGQYPPGSIFKIVPAAAILEEGVVDDRTTRTCRGEMFLPNRYFPDDPEMTQVFVCWNEWGHGNVDIVDALALSCDIYFYQVTGGFEDFDGLGMPKLAEYASAFGFGEPTGIALPGESAGLVPDDRWKRVNYGGPWVTGDTYNAAIGQGFVLVTPLQMLNATAAVANGGTLYRPQVVLQIIDNEGRTVRDFGPQVIRNAPISAENLDIVREGMRAAVTRGTANRANLEEVTVAGKTGTAEYAGPRDEEGNLPSHAWFLAFAPYEDPEIALVVFVSGGHNGAKVAAPIAARILRAHFALPQPVDEELVGPAPGD